MLTRLCKNRPTSSSGLCDRTNVSASQKQTSKTKAVNSNDVDVQVEAEAELVDLSAEISGFREGTRETLTNLARIAKSSGASVSSIESLRYDIKEFARLKNTSLEALEERVAALHQSFAKLDALTITGGDAEPATDMQVLPEPLQCDDILEENILSFLSIGDVSRGVAYVCKRWYKGARGEKLWKRMLKRDWIDIVATLCGEGILTSTPKNEDQFTFLAFAEQRFKNDGMVRQWLAPEMMDSSPIRKQLAYKPEEIHIAAWLNKNDKVECGAKELSMLCRGVIIPPIFQHYENVVLAEYERRDHLGEEEYGDDPVLLPEVPIGLSPMAVEYHNRARNAARRIYLKHNGELKKYRVRFSYSNDHALYLASTGAVLTSSEVISALSYYSTYFENETW